MKCLGLEPQGKASRRICSKPHSCGNACTRNAWD
nr:MAG TPA: hypothetical protein [Caudoviricetes sp.]